MLASDALGNPVRLIATAGQVADVSQGEALVSGLQVKHVIADKGYDSDKVGQGGRGRGSRGGDPSAIEPEEGTHLG